MGHLSLSEALWRISTRPLRGRWVGALGCAEAPHGSPWRCSCDEKEEAPRLKRGGDLHPARPDLWPPTKRPWAARGGLIVAGVTHLSRREGVPPCLHRSPPLDGTLGVHRTSWRIPFPRHASGVLLVLELRLESKSSAGLRMQPYRRSPGQVWPCHLHGWGCLSARAMDTGFPTVVWRLCLGLGLAVTPPILAAV